MYIFNLKFPKFSLDLIDYNICCIYFILKKFKFYWTLDDDFSLVDVFTLYVIHNKCKNFYKVHAIRN